MSSFAKRNEIPTELCWDLSHIYENESAYQADLARVKTETSAFAQNYQNKIAASGDPAFLLEAIKAFESIVMRLEWLSSYASLSVSVDYGNAEANSRELELNAQVATLSAQLSFFDSELKELSPAVLEELRDLAPAYAPVVQDLLDDIPHKLSAEVERVLAEFRPLFDLPENGYQQTKLADMRFADFNAEEKNFPLSFVLYENNYCHDPRSTVRRAAFAGFSETLSAYQNTIATDYFARVQSEKTLARLRGFDSVIDYLLHGQRVTRELYDRQIDLIMTELAPHMRRYAKLLQRFFRLDELRYADLKLTLDPDYAPQVDIPAARRLVEDALARLGPEYSEIVRRAFDERRLDFAQNEGKSTGGFCASPYRKGSFILLNWGGELSEVFTLAHELGHLGHFALAQSEQPLLSSECSWYLVEAPSTLNELLLTQYLLAEKADDPRFRRWVLASMVGNSYYHNFVTHLLEAAYQREVYRRVDAGQALQADDFSEIFAEQLRIFWGDSVQMDAGSELTWMRQPHYYNGLYPYTYSAGLTIATAVSQRIDAEGQPAVDDWLRTLRAGGSLRPLDFARSAGVSIDSDKALRDTIAYIGSLIAEIEKLTDEIGDC